MVVISKAPLGFLMGFGHSHSTSSVIIYDFANTPEIT